MITFPNQLPTLGNLHLSMANIITQHLYKIHKQRHPELWLATCTAYHCKKIAVSLNNFCPDTPLYLKHNVFKQHAVFSTGFYSNSIKSICIFSTVLPFWKVEVIWNIFLLPFSVRILSLLQVYCADKKQTLKPVRLLLAQGGRIWECESLYHSEIFTGVQLSGSAPILQHWEKKKNYSLTRLVLMQQKKTTKL